MKMPSAWFSLANVYPTCAFPYTLLFPKYTYRQASANSVEPDQMPQNDQGLPLIQQVLDTSVVDVFIGHGKKIECSNI